MWKSKQIDAVNSDSKSLQTLSVTLIFLSFVICIFFSANCKADWIFKDTGPTNGIVISFDHQSIKMSNGCGAAEIYTIPWNRVEAIFFQGECSEKPVIRPILPENDCGETREEVIASFVLKFRKNPELAFAETIGLSPEHTFYSDMYIPQEQWSGPKEAVSSITYKRVCRDKIVASSNPPMSFCIQPKRFAAEFNNDTPLSNKILTNGFSFKVQTHGDLPKNFDLPTFTEKVRSAFGTALTIWIGALSDQKAKLPNEVQEFVAGRTFGSSSGITLLLPPQVIIAECIDRATFVVKLVFAEDEIFPKWPLILAKAEIEGRTIALNMRDISCFSPEAKFNDQKQLRFTVDNDCLNLVPIIMHELGHAFGLRHSDIPNQPALMDSRFSRKALTPQKIDVEALSNVLNTSITGAEPGLLSFQESDGVRPPKDWKPN